MTDFIIKNGALKKYTRNKTKVVIPDSVTDIGERAFEGCEDLVIKTPENSFAQKYAEENGMKFKVINR